MCIRDSAWARSNWQTYCVWLPDGVEQATAMAGLRDRGVATVSYTNLRAHETVLDLVCRLMLDKKKKKK